MMPQALRLLLVTVVSLVLMGRLPAEASEYRMRAGDSLNITVVGHPELAVLAQPIRPDGHVSLPMIAPVLAEGRTVVEVTSEIQDAYKPFLTKPRVLVSIAQFRPLRIAVLGQVEQSGSFEFAKPPTLVEAIARAGGLGRRASRGAITVVDPGTQTRKTYDLDRLLAGKEPNPDLSDGGIVEVGEVWGPDLQVWLPILASLVTAAAFFKIWD